MAEFSDAKSGAYCTCTRERCSDECRTYRQFRPKPVTNADCIRSMTDEKLAEWLWLKVGKCPPFNVCPSQRIPCEAKDCWLDWLKQEATDGKQD